MTQDLVHLARSQQLDSLEQAWGQATQAPQPDHTDRYATVIDLLCERDMASRALGMATAMVESLATRGQTQAALELGFRVMRRSAHNDALAKTIVDLIDKRYGDQEWLPPLKTRSGLVAAVTVNNILEFDRLRRYTQGFVVYHGAGWGEGTIEGFAAANQEVTVRFASGRTETFPLDTLLTSFKSLDPNDLRAMKLQRMEQLQKEAEDDPSALIRRTAGLYRGTITSQQLKNELSPSVVSTKDWNGFWKRAKTAAARDPWLKVEGSATRPTFVLRNKPVSLVEEASVALTHANDFGQRIGVLRDYLARSEDPEMRNQILDLASKTVEQAIEEKKASHAHILDGILFLEEHGFRASIPAAQEVRALLVKDDGSLRPTAIDRLATQASREHAIELLPQALGENWCDQCIVTLTEWPNSVLEKLVDRINLAGNGGQCLAVWEKIAPYPRRFPLLTYLLGKQFCDGLFEGMENAPTAMAMGRVLLHLGRILNEDRKKNLLHSRILGRLTSLLTGKRGLLHRALDGISREDLQTYLGILGRSGDDFPQDIVDLIDRKVIDDYPELLAKPELPFWEKDHIFTTREGLRRIKDDYRLLVEEKIPANSKAIGAAAALGDLSENSEWESAMEEQRNLTGRAQDMDQQIRSARLIEDQDVPEDRVAPGTKVTLVDTATQAKVTYKVLGPWDIVDDHTINYLAPMAQGLLGKQVGELAAMPGQHGASEVRIEAIERLV
ncbi:MAG: GreA/GreB family elongation factor [Planctomycetes bacterium]|nr:GreA/GreB family elongation factor [Planctomycetota bacterium]